MTRYSQMTQAKSQPRKCKFSPEEDLQLTDLVAVHGDEDWITISCLMPGRNPRQCRERWRHSLSPTVSLTPFTADEDALLRGKYAEMGPKWKAMAARFNARTDIMLKNRWLLLDRHQKRAETAPLAVKLPDKRALILPAIERRPPVETEPTDIPWSDDEDARPQFAQSSELTGDYFCLNFACFE
jgi:hypothetical protein